LDYEEYIKGLHCGNQIYNEAEVRAYERNIPWQDIPKRIFNLGEGG
jgi:hypothetical protein